MKGKRGEVRGRLQRLREGGLGGDGGGERASVRVGYRKPAKFEKRFPFSVLLPVSTLRRQC